MKALCWMGALSSCCATATNVASATLSNAWPTAQTLAASFARAGAKQQRQAAAAEGRVTIVERPRAGARSLEEKFEMTSETCKSDYRMGSPLLARPRAAAGGGGGGGVAALPSAMGSAAAAGAVAPQRHSLRLALRGSADVLGAEPGGELALLDEEDETMVQQAGTC
eukprot:658-Chlamydomonas_euryale.AAC.1